MISPPPTEADPHTLAAIAEGLAADGVYDPDPAGERHFRIGAPLPLDPATVAFLEGLGDRILAFYHALSGLYRRSARGTAPPFVAQWLNQGKPDDLLRHARMGRFNRQVPGILRPDLFLTEHGFKMTELDSVPGGMGISDALNSRYADASFNVIGGADGIADGMATMLRGHAEAEDPTVAVVVSDESAGYRGEMGYLSMRLKALGLSTHLLQPSEVTFSEHGLSFSRHGEPVDIDVLYRFFELFDLNAVPKSELMLYAARKGLVTMTPPAKPQLEEKLAMALLHHPALEGYWQAELKDDFDALTALMPHTWVMDPAPVPAHAIIPGLAVNNAPVRDFGQLKGLGQKARQLVIKPSGFSEQAWGSRGVVIGHDVSEAEWDAAIDQALASFDDTPHILQPFHKAVTAQAAYLGDQGGMVHMRARTRLCPYYFVADGQAKLGGVLATQVPADKKKIHGMKTATMTPAVFA